VGATATGTPPGPLKKSLEGGRERLDRSGFGGVSVRKKGQKKGKGGGIPGKGVNQKLRFPLSQNQGQKKKVGKKGYLLDSV